MKSVLITGLEGFVGGHLGQFFLDNGYRVGGTIFAEESEFIKQNKSEVFIQRCNIADKEEVNSVISEFKPDIVIHLAAISYVPFSWKDPVTTFNTNLSGTISILEAVKNNVPGTKIIFISSCNVYGKGDGNYPITESTPLKPDNFYALSKLMGEELCNFYQDKFNLEIIVVRPFNHIGPGQAPSFVISSFAQQVALIEKGKQAPAIYVGDLSASRDFCDVRDIIRGYKLLAESDLNSGIFNICSGVPIAIKDALEILLTKTDVEIKVEIDKERFRPSDIPVYYGDFSLLNKETGWEPEISFDKTISEILDYWRERV